MESTEALLEGLARRLVKASPGLVFWSGAGFLNQGLPESLLSSVGTKWSADAAKSYCSFVSLRSRGQEAERSRVSVVMAAPCHPGQIFGLTLLADAGLLNSVVLLEQRKPSSWGMFEKRQSNTGAYLHDIGLADAGWLEWDGQSKAEERFEEILREAQESSPSFFVVCCRDEEASVEPIDFLSDEVDRVLSKNSPVSTDGPTTVFASFLGELRANADSENVFWVPEKLADLADFRRQLSLFRKLQSKRTGRPVVVLNSAVLPDLYADLKLWCETCREENDTPILLLYGSGLGFHSPDQGGGLSDCLLLLSVRGLNVAVPADEEEAKILFRGAESAQGPSAIVFTQSPAVGLSTGGEGEPGKGRRLREGKDLALVAIGSTVFPALLAAESLQALGLSVAVVDMRYRRPLDIELIESLGDYPLILAVDEHPEVGGIAGHLSRPATARSKIDRLGIEMSDFQSVAAELRPDDPPSLEHFGLHAEGIALRVRECLQLKTPSTFS